MDGMTGSAVGLPATPSKATEETGATAAAATTATATLSLSLTTTPRYLSQKGVTYLAK